MPGGYPICFIDNAKDETVLDYAVGSNLNRFLKFLMEREMKIVDGWPFNAEVVLSDDPADPAIGKVTIAPLPWNVD